MVSRNEFHEQSIVVFGERNSVAKAKLIMVNERVTDVILTGLSC
jgi:hypothetical protein